MIRSAVGDWARESKRTLILWGFLILSFLVGIAVRMRPTPYTSREVMYIRLVGDLWMNAVRAVALPLLVTTIASSLCELKLLYSLRLASFLCIWIIATKIQVGLFSALFMMIMNAIMKTNEGLTSRVQPPAPVSRASVGDCVLDLLMDALPDNPVEACVRHSSTRLKPLENTTAGEGNPYEDYKADKSEYIYQASLLGVVVGTMAVGAAMTLLQDKVANLLEVTQTVRDTCLVLSRWLLVVGGPFYALVIIAELAGAPDLPAQIIAMDVYIVAVIVAFFVQAILVYPTLYVLIGARWKFGRPFNLLWHLSEALMVAVGSQSAHVPYPYAYEAVTTKHNTDPTAAGLVLGIMSAANNDGTAALLTAGGLWAARRQGAAGAGQVLGSVALGLLGSVACAGESLMHSHLLVMTMTTLGFNTRPQDVAPMLGVAWLLNPLASAVNIAGSAFAAATFGSIRQRQLEKGEGDGTKLPQ